MVLDFITRTVSGDTENLEDLGVLWLEKDNLVFADRAAGVNSRFSNDG
jgi:hypothetical protein